MITAYFVFSLFCIFVFGPLIVAIHELGHALAIRLFKGTIIEIHLTNGRPIINFGKFYIGINFTNGSVVWDRDSVTSSYKRAIISASGCIMTLFTGSIYTSLLFLGNLTNLMIYISNFFSIPFGFVAVCFILMSCMLIVSSIAPLIPIHKRTDGWSIVQNLKGK